jgi:hypothetical protein
MYNKMYHFTMHFLNLLFLPNCQMLDVNQYASNTVSNEAFDSTARGFKSQSDSELLSGFPWPMIFKPEIK